MKLLIIVPHPDDEVYGASGTLMQYLEEGHKCGLVTLTRGEAGRTLGLCSTPEELAELRKSELAECLGVIGIKQHEQHSFPDKYLSSVPLQELAGVAKEAMLRHKPEIVLTFPPNGSNGHPDHVSTHKAVQSAWKSLPKEQRPRLWYYASQTPPDNTELLSQWLPPNIKHDISPYLIRKLQAISCHRSQALSTVDFIKKYPERVVFETFYELEK